MSEHLILGASGAPRTVASLAQYINGFPFKPDDFTPEGLPVIRIKQLNDSNADLDYFDGPVANRHLLRDGDVVFSWSGSLSVARWSRGPAILNQHLFRVLPREGVDADWLLHALSVAIRLFEPYMHGSTLRHITAPMMKAVKVPVPDIAQQREIALELAEHDSTTQVLTGLTGTHTTLLSERRVALVTAAVTGELDVTTARSVA